MTPSLNCLETVFLVSSYFEKIGFRLKQEIKLKIHLEHIVINFVRHQTAPLLCISPRPRLELAYISQHYCHSKLINQIYSNSHQPLLRLGHLQTIYLIVPTYNNELTQFSTKVSRLFVFQFSYILKNSQISFQICSFFVHFIFIRFVSFHKKCRSWINKFAVNTTFLHWNLNKKIGRPLP